ncbi:MAG TPA: PP2C family protein-serine/threonine phosphatase [Acidimicrobiales bacterium]|nr:PP2C family protein-serine/threonine phosphatase [Acidimicrobiales bacterium]
MSRGADHGLNALLDDLAGLDAADLPGRLEVAAESAGMSEVGIYLADLQEQALVPWPAPPGAEPMGIDASLPGLVFRRGIASPDGSGRWWFPLGDGHQRMGVVSVVLGSEEAEAVRAGSHLAALAGLLVVSRSAYCDDIERARRLRPLSLAAELRWATMPPRVMASPRVTVAGVLEPAYEIAGDSFDYALDQDRLRVAVFDAMGHGLDASRLVTLAITSYRHSRRSGLDLAATYRAMDEVVAGTLGEGVFVTGHMAELDTSSGRLSVLNAGHPHPLLIRGGTAHELAFPPATPVGLGFVEAEVGEVRLQPGDAVVVLSDGVIEARSAGGDIFGVERVGDLAVRALAGGETIPETVRRLIGSVLEHRGVSLEDDATLLLFSWNPTQH